MTREFDAQQAPLWVRSELVLVNLIHLITYSDRDAETVDEHFYFADMALLFDWEDNGTNIGFWPVIQSLDPLNKSINHLSSPNDSGLLTVPWSFTLVNVPYGAGGERLINILRDGHTLENARIEWTQLALAARPTTAIVDQTSLAGDEHTFWYRGRIRQVGPISGESIVLDCEMELPELSWARSLDDTQTEPDHVGVRWPKVAGEAKGVACINHDVGFVTTLAEADDGTGTSLELTDATGFGSTGEATIGGSVVSWGGKSGNTLTSVVQGIGSSPACNHAAGDLVVETITTALFGVADSAVSAINNVYAINPYSGARVRITSPITKNVADTVDGETRATLEATKPQLQTILRELAASPEVTDDGSGNPDPATLQQPIQVAHSGPYYKHRPAIHDGQATNNDPYAGVDEDEYFHCKFFRRPEGYGRQKIQVIISLQSGAGSLEFYKGRYDIDTGDDLVLLQTDTLLAGTNTYTCNTTADAEWVTYRIISGGSVTTRFYECRQYVDYTADITHEQATQGQIEGYGTVSSGDWFDEDDETFEVLQTTDIWGSCRFPDSSFDTQRIRMLMGTHAGSNFAWYMKVGDSHNGGSGITNENEPTQTQDPAEFVVETDEQGRYATFYKEDTFAIGLVDISRDIITYGPAPGPSITIAGASIGYGLRLDTDSDGYVSPTTEPDYKCGDAALIKLAVDLLRYIIEELGGETVDYDSYDDAYTNLGGASGVEVAGDLRTFGMSWEENAQRVAFESRVTLVPEETATGRVWKMLTALSTYAFSAASGAITEWAPGGFVEVGRALRDELATRFFFPYAPDWSRGDGEEAYVAALVANEDVNDLTVPDDAAFAAAVAKFGNINAEPIAFRALWASGYVDDVGGYYAHELIRGPALFAIRGVPWWQAYALEVGDIVEVTPPWGDTPIKCRILEIIKDPSTELVELRLMEVE